MVENTVALEEYLQPLAPYLNDPVISDICINQPGQISIEKNGVLQQIQAVDLTFYHLNGLADLIASYNQKTFNAQTPILSANLPQGHRIQLIRPPACENGKVILSIRKQVVRDLSLSDYESQGAFEFTKPFYINDYDFIAAANDKNIRLKELFESGNFVEFLKEAICTKKNIIISGATNTGKTTFLNACLKEIPQEERIITLEDTREVQLSHPEKVHLLAIKEGQGRANINMVNLIEASLRLRPDRIIMGELRGAEAADFCNAAATGHDGSMATLHASNPQIAFMRLIHLVKLNPQMHQMSRADILADLHALIPIVVQLERVQEGEKVRRVVVSVYYRG